MVRAKKRNEETIRGLRGMDCPEMCIVHVSRIRNQRQLSIAFHTEQHTYFSIVGGDRQATVMADTNSEI